VHENPADGDDFLDAHENGLVDAGRILEFEAGGFLDAAFEDAGGLAHKVWRYLSLGGYTQRDSEESACTNDQSQ